MFWLVAGGERNAQGAGVWKRVRLKLEGKDPDAGRRANHHEQVVFRRRHRRGGPWATGHALTSFVCPGGIHNK